MNTTQWHFSLRGSNLAVAAQHGQRLTLQSLTHNRTGWYKLRLRYLDSQQADAAVIALFQNNNPLSVDLVREADGFSLIFFRHHPLTSLTLEWQHQTSTAARFEIQLSQISHWSAVWQMLHTVRRNDKQLGLDPLRIVKKSYARWRKQGETHSLHKLVHEYRSALGHQLVSCEPYLYWQQKVEPVYKHQLGMPAPVQLFFVIALEAEGTETQLMQSILSVLQQDYHYWQLQLNLSQPASAELANLIASEPRISKPTLDDTDSPQHYFWLRMQAGDKLASDAMRYWAHAIHTRPETRILYTDHDELTANAQRVNPQFKPQWNPDLLMSYNYMGPAVLYRGDIIQPQLATALTPPHSTFTAHSTHARVLNAVASIAPELRELGITHQALISYHQAQANISAELLPAEQQQILTALTQWCDADKHAVKSIEASAAAGCFRVRYQLPAEPPLVSLLIPTRDGLDVLQTCVESILLKTTYPHYEILILDNQSIQPETLQWFEQMAEEPRVRILSYPHPFNFSAINNFGVNHAKGSIIGLVNNDIEVINPDWLSEMVSQALRPEIGAVGAKLYFFDNTIQHAGVVLGLWGLAGHSHKHYQREAAGYSRRLHCVQNYSAVTAACLVVSKEKYTLAGGLNEEHLTVAFNDVDFCLKLLEAGYRNLWTPYAELYHYESKSRGPEDTPEKKERERKEIAYMQQHWAHRLQQDPCYSPHLSHQREDFSIRFSP